MKNKWLKLIVDIIGIIIGVLILSFSLNKLIIPSHLLSGGITGIAILIYHMTGWSVGIQNFIYNIPLLILGYIYLGRRFTFYSTIGVISLTYFLKIIPVDSIWTDEILLNAIFGGILSGIGVSIILRIGGSAGGLDIISRLVTRYRSINFSKFSLIINSIIIIVSAYFFNVQIAMYTLISVYTTTRTFDTLLNHVGRITVFIITDKGEEISEAVTKKMKRGVTFWDGSGAYSHSNKQVLMSVIVNAQWHTLKKTVLEVDQKAFISVVPTQNIVGNFHKIW